MRRIHGDLRYSVVGRILFLLFINDLPEYLSCNTTVRLFANVCQAYHTIGSEADCTSLGRHQLTGAMGSRLAYMEFNPKKCQVLHVSTKRKPIINSYIIHGHTLEDADTAKYLGIDLHKKLSWNYHIDQVTKKANSTPAFLQRNIRSWPRKVKVLCYLTLLRQGCQPSRIWRESHAMHHAHFPAVPAARNGRLPPPRPSSRSPALRKPSARCVK